MEIRTLSLVKGQHKYVFKYSDGDESRIVDEIMRLAEDADSDIDWLDAAKLSFQVAQHAARELPRLQPQAKNPTTT